MNKNITIKYITLIALIMLSIFAPGKSAAQCGVGTVNAGLLCPGTTPQTIATSAGQYFQFPAAAGCTYYFSFCQNGGSYVGDSYLTLTDNNGTVLLTQDDYCGLGSHMIWTAPSAGTYRIHHQTYYCQNDGQNRTMAYWSSCAPSCSGTPTAGTAVASQTNYNCQGSPSLSLTGNSVACNLSYQWQSRPVGGTWANLGSIQASVNYTVTTPITVSTEYRVWVRCNTTNLTDTSAPVTVNVTGTVITPATATSICTPPGSQVLAITAPPLPDTLFKENFNGTTNQMTVSTGAGYGWQKTNNNYLWSYPYYTFVNSDGSSFFLTYCDYTYSLTPNTAMTPVFSTVGYTTASLTFRHAVLINSYPVTLEISTNGGSSWTTLQTYNSQQGNYNNFVPVTISLNSYLNQPNLRLRYSYIPYYGYSCWAVDDIAITGAHPLPLYSWTATPSTGAGLPAGAGTPSAGNTSITATPSTGSYTYTATIANIPAGCATTKNVVINSNPKPTAVMSGTTAICNGQSTVVGINFTAGTPPFNFTYTDGTTPTTLTNVTNTTMNIPVNPSSTTVYKITALSDVACVSATAQFPDSVTVTVHPRPTATMNNQTYQICDGSTAYLPVTLTGTPPFSLTYYDGSNYTTLNNIMTTNYQMPVPTTLGSTTYTITALNDANCLAWGIDITGSNTVSAYVRPTAVITGNPTICNGSFGQVQVALTGAPPYSFTYGDGGSFNYTVSNIMTSPYTLTVTPSSTVTYNLTSVSDVNCSSLPIDLSGSSMVTVNARPTGTMSGVAQTLCHGDQINLTATFTGTPPYSLTYSDGNSTALISPINTNTYSFTVTPQATGSYVIAGLSDANCVSFPSDLNGATPITVRHPAAAISGTQVSCTGGATDLMVDFSGAGLTAPYTFSYSDGSQTSTVTTTNDPYTLTVNTTGDATYTLTSFNDANCNGDISGQATVVANPSGGWKGMVSSDWQNAANWCGNLPTATTDVLIPAAAPHQPVLGNGIGYSRNLTVMPGASVTVNSGANMFIHGNLTNNGTVDMTAGNINFNGNVNHTSSGFVAQTLGIGVGSSLMPTGDIQVNALLSLSGNIHLDSTDLIIKPGGLIIGQGFNNYVHTHGTGSLRMPVSTAPVLFPVGSTAYNPVRLTNAGVPDEYNVRVFDAVFADGYGVDSARVQFPVVNRTWMIEEEVAGGSDVTIQPFWNAGEGINFFDHNAVFIRHWDGTEWAFNYADSSTAPAALGWPGFGPYSVVESGFTSFSPYTVGAKNLYPLAVNLVDFTATLSGANDAMLNWEVTQSSDAQLFEIERSTDGENYTKVGEVKAQQDKTGYSTLDRGLAAGRNYYRLRMTDMSGRTGYSNVAVVITKGGGVEVVTLAPNPVTGTGVAMISSDEAVSAEVSIMDAVGHVLYKGSHELTSGLNKVSLDMNQLAPGNYTLHVLTSNGHATPVKFTKL